jgi:hypothetical protein
VKKLAISAFVLFHLIAIACWSSPIDSPLIDAVRRVVRPYMLWSGLFQAWNMFAPLPSSQNEYLQGIVITHDGHIHTWPFPRMEQLGLATRYSKERYRKFVENVTQGQNAPIWPDVAKHLASFYNNDPNNSPEIVMLVRYFSAIDPQTQKPGPERGQILFEYRLLPGDLK